VAEGSQRVSAQGSPRALVLGGGGPVGASWTSGLLQALVSDGIPLTESDVVLGTSAGAVVGAWLTIQPDGLSGLPERMGARASWHAENTAQGYGDKDLLRRVIARAPGDTALSIAQAAVDAIPPISADQATTLWRAALPDGPWSPQLRIVAVNAGTGRARVWSAIDGVSLAVAVACSTAAPGAAPPVEVTREVWVDGGVRSNTNADLLIDLDDSSGNTLRPNEPSRVVVVAPFPSAELVRDEAALTDAGHSVRTITADAFYSSPADFMDPDFVGIAASAGTAQGGRIANDLAAWWGRT
jgi:NTE family protein